MASIAALRDEIVKSSGENSVDSVSVVVCAYTTDRWETLRHAIDVTLKQMSIKDELLLVVDHNESLLEHCREAFTNCVIIPNRHTLGLSGARNTALEDAKGSLVVFLDDDAVPGDGWLDALRGPYADMRVYGVGGLTKPHWYPHGPSWFPDEFLWVVGCSHKGLPSVMHPVRNLVGANMSFRKSAFDSVGGFVETMGRVGDKPLGCEETEFSIRLTQANPSAVLLHNPAAQVEHHVSEQRRSVHYFARRCWAEGLSKAQVARRVGRTSALSAERDYTWRVLPRGILQGLHECITGDAWGAARAAIIVLGLIFTTAGYCVGNFHRTDLGSEDV